MSKKRRSRAKHPDGLPRGSYRLPEGGYVVESRHLVGSGRNQRAIRIRAVHRDTIDAKQLARVLIQLARDDLERERDAS